MSEEGLHVGGSKRYLMSYDTATAKVILCISRGKCPDDQLLSRNEWLSIGPFLPLIFFSGGGGCWACVTITIGRVPGK